MSDDEAKQWREREEHRRHQQQVDEREQRSRVVRCAVRDAHAELQHRRLVDDALLDELLREHEMARVEDLDLGAHAELADLPRHLAQHRGRVRHDVVALGEVHRPAVERADLRPQVGDVGQPLRRTGCPLQLAPDLGQGTHRAGDHHRIDHELDQRPDRHHLGPHVARPDPEDADDPGKGQENHDDRHHRPRPDP